MKLKLIRIDLAPFAYLPRWCGHYTEFTWKPKEVRKVFRFFWGKWIWKITYYQTGA